MATTFKFRGHYTIARVWCMINISPVVQPFEGMSGKGWELRLFLDHNGTLYTQVTIDDDNFATLFALTHGELL